jgi:hypothetical protein
MREQTPRCARSFGKNAEFLSKKRKKEKMQKAIDSVGAM